MRDAVGEARADAALDVSHRPVDLAVVLDDASRRAARLGDGFIFGGEGNDTMFGSVFQDNPASARVLVHCGFDYVGDAESYSVARAATVPTWTYLSRMG